MKRLELIELLSSSKEDEVFIMDEDGYLHEIGIESVEEKFDGFYTVSPASIGLKMID